MPISFSVDGVSFSSASICSAEDRKDLSTISPPTCAGHECPLWLDEGRQGWPAAGDYARTSVDALPPAAESVSMLIVATDESGSCGTGQMGVPKPHQVKQSANNTQGLQATTVRCWKHF